MSSVPASGVPLQPPSSAAPPSPALNIVGPLTIYTVSEWCRNISSHLAACADANIVIDISAIEELDTAGLQLLLAMTRHCAEQSRSLVFLNAAACVRETLQLCGLAELILSAGNKAERQRGVAEA